MEQDRTLWLTGLEYDVQICAMEASGILPYLVEHRRPDGEWPSNSEVVATVRSAVDRDWVTVHRWDDPAGTDWIGEVTLSPTPEWELFLAGRRYAPLATWTRH